MPEKNIEENNYRAEFARLIIEKADKYKSHKSDLTKRAVDIYFEYIGRPRAQNYDAQSDADKRGKKSWRTDVHPKFLKTKALAAWSQSIQSIAANKDMIDVTPVEGEQNDGKGMKEEINQQFERGDFSEKIKTGFLEKIIYGSMFMEAPYVQTRKIKKPMLDYRGTMNNLLMGKMQKAYKIGTEVMEEPVVLNRNWFEMYPAPYASDLQSCEGVVHRPFISEYDLIDLMSKPGFDRKAIKRALDKGPAPSPDHDTAIERTGSRYSSGVDREGFDLICYSGKVPLRELAKIRPDIVRTDDKPTGYIEIRAWVLSHGDGGELLKVEPNYDVIGHRPYYMSVYERVPYETFGVGVGENISDMSKLIRGAVNMFVDAKKLALPMIGVNAQKKTPGMNLSFAPFKVWQFNGDPKETIFPFNFPDVSNGLIPLIELAERYADEVTGIPKWTTGVDTKMLNKTATGISMLMNASSQLMRGAIENLDDYIIEPIATEFYLWNMQFNPRQDIKGIFTISASGISTLMQKETLNQQLMGLLSFIINPAVMQNPYALKMLRMIGDTMGIKDVDSVIPKPEELERVANMNDMQMQQALSSISAPGQMSTLQPDNEPAIMGVM